MDAKATPMFRADWTTKALAGLLLGLTLAVGCSGIFARLADAMPSPLVAQLAMWMVAPIWLGTLAASFGFSSGRQALTRLLMANGAVWASFFVVRLF